MIAYKRDEMVGITELGKSLGAYMDKVKEHTLDKLTIIRRNKPEVVMVDIEKYERLEMIADMVEQLSIQNIINQRVPNNEFKGGFDLEEYHKKRMKKRADV